MVVKEKALEGNFITRFSNIQAKRGQSAKDQKVRVMKLSAGARVPMQGSAKATAHDLYANKGTGIPARGQTIVGTGIAIKLLHNT